MIIFLLIFVAWFAIGFMTAVGIKVQGWPNNTDIPMPPQTITITMWPIVYIVLISHFMAIFVENNIPNLVDKCAAMIKKPQDEPKDTEQDQIKQNELS